MLLAALPAPGMMELIVDGDVLEKHSSIYTGNYTLAEGLVNGFPYWNQQDGNNAIWSVWSSIWLVGHKNSLGNPIGGIGVQFDIKVWPTQILDGFRYAPGWQYASLNEVFFKDCKYKRVLFTCSSVQK